MKRNYFFRSLTVLLGMTILACALGGGGEGIRPVGATDAHDPALRPQVFKCEKSNCPEITIRNNAWIKKLSGGFSMRGYADPSIFKDPDTGRFYMAYTYVKGGATAVGRIQGGGLLTNLAVSDNGRNWEFVETINGPARLEVDGKIYTGMYEVADIAPGADGWYGIWLNYGKDAKGAHVPQALRFELTHAMTPEGLADSPRVSLGGEVMSRNFAPATNLSAINGAPSCKVWTEPAILVRDDNLYLLAECTHEQYHVFVAPAISNVATLQWRYAGAVPNLAPHLAKGAQFLSQGDIALSRDDRLLLITTPMQREGKNNIHRGCYVIEMASLDPPALALYDGKPRVRAVIADPKAAKLGPGACSYDPDSDNGVLFVTREFDRINREIRFVLHATGIHP